MKAVEKSRVQKIIQLHNDVVGSLKKAMTVGELLTDQKAEMKHGEWLPWVEKNT